jgi:hypothetical protein
VSTELERHAAPGAAETPVPRRVLDHVADASFFLGLVLLLVGSGVFTMGFR